MNTRSFINILIALLAVFIIFNLVVPFASKEGFTEGVDSPYVAMSKRNKNNKTKAPAPAPYAGEFSKMTPEQLKNVTEQCEKMPPEYRQQFINNGMCPKPETKK